MSPIRVISLVLALISGRCLVFPRVVAYMYLLRRCNLIAVCLHDVR